MKNVIVFGGSGFLGSHVADELSKRGYFVTIFDKTKSKYLRPDQKMVVGNILDQNAVREEVSKNSIIYHFAAIADISESKVDPISTVNFNILGTMYILDAAREFNVERVVYSSTIYVYSDYGSFYRSTKQSCELFIENYQKEFGLNFSILRYGSLYGPRANSFNFIRNSIMEAILNGKITRNGDGEEVRDYINVLDAAVSSVDVLNKEYDNSYIMITGSQTMKVNELLNMINEIFSNKIEISYDFKIFDGHYKITPYSFKPKVALKITPRNFHDLGQGILDEVYNSYQEVINSGAIPKVNIKL